jgi:hypothetical protein
MSIQNNCEQINTEKLIICGENGRTITIKNNYRWEICIVQIDNCLINDNSKRCDIMVRLPSQKKIEKGIQAIKLVEFKGSDVAKAFEQLETTLNHPAIAPDKPFINECLIASKFSPSFSGTMQSQKLIFLEKYNMPVQIGRKNLIIDIENP